MAIKIAEYTFNSSTNTLPIFNSGYDYDYTDINNGDGTTTRTITSDSLPSSISFKRKTGLVSVSYLDTSSVTDMRNMFYECSNLTTIDLSNFNTSNVTDMSFMFCECTSLTSLDLSNFNTSNVTNMFCMFYSCSKLTSLDLSSFDIGNVTDMNQMFENCINLTSLNLSNFNIGNATTILWMFSGCSNLTSVNMDNINVDSINDIIAALPTRASDSYGTIIVSKTVFNSVDITSANSKHWNIIKEPEYTFTLDTLRYLLTNIKNKFVTKEELNNKVDKVEGKELSSNNFSDEDINNINDSFDDAEINQSGTIMSFYSTSVNGVKTKIKDINLDI